MIVKVLILEIRDYIKDFCIYKDLCLWLYLVILEVLLNMVYIKSLFL